MIDRHSCACRPRSQGSSSNSSFFLFFLSAKVIFEYLEPFLTVTAKDFKAGKITRDELSKHLLDMLMQISRVNRGIKIEGNLSPFEEWILDRVKRMEEQCTVVIDALKKTA